jgi:hypothetical protein
MSESFIRKNVDYINWESAKIPFHICKFSEEFKDEMMNKIPIDVYIASNNLSDEFVLRNKATLDFKIILREIRLKESVLQQCMPFLNKELIAKTQILSEEFIIKNNIDVSKIVFIDKLSVPFVKKHINEINFSKLNIFFSPIKQSMIRFLIKSKKLSKHQLGWIIEYNGLSGITIDLCMEELIKLDLLHAITILVLSQKQLEKLLNLAKDKPAVCRAICLSNIFSPELINKYHNFIPIDALLVQQKVDESIIEQHIDELNPQLLEYQELSEEFIIKYMDIIPVDIILSNNISDDLRHSIELLH